MKSKHLFYTVMLACLMGFVLAIANFIYRDIALSITGDVHVEVNNATHRQAPDYSFRAFYDTLPANTRANVPYCELPSSDIQHADVESSHPIRCANSGELPTTTQSDLWTDYEMWKLCNQFHDESACIWLLN